MKPKTLALCLSCSLLLAACSGDGEKIGTASGAVIGGIVGSQLGSKMGDGTGSALGTGLGAIFGAWLGKEIGRALDEADLAAATQTTQETLETADRGETKSWSNPDSGNSGTTTAKSDGECRDFESTVTIDGEEEMAIGRACRQSDGSWKIIE
ncbi:MAG: glycine zipper 2TM domain-containing protein [Rhodospirillaceae bacterium]|jgi:surface antigen|nr:glycine zipper 2TM domain-containing protein [Rhodospirillaceae bacterium]MBT4219904.1 glycine zipper 2TM domain-containing protein [Rhodospirillaceae bacterium]MBT4463455.1 glycine zipper 2TM domain-containing protein [Rhodospirillaceae bacterium]MBT5013882.1 glycine zipper 2TM domain-containing protein [Rhodospirillaceae bacterium]MBT5309200.1 glycine zipper 2TM domain-containing protein [Rhodospirillaceae bacterium]